jgi:hypothetical protein
VPSLTFDVDVEVLELPRTWYLMSRYELVSVEVDVEVLGIVRRSWCRGWCRAWACVHRSWCRVLETLSVELMSSAWACVRRSWCRGWCRVLEPCVHQKLMSSSSFCSSSWYVGVLEACASYCHAQVEVQYLWIKKA